MPAKYSESDLLKLYQLAKQEGWEKLEPGEKRAVLRWCRRTGRAFPDGAPAETAKPEKAPESKGDYFKALGFHEVAGDDGKVGYVTDEAAHDMELLKSVRFVEDWPADINTTPAYAPSKWVRPAEALKRFPGRIAVIASNLRRRSATGLRQRLRSGAVPAFRPKGAYRIEIAPDHEHEGMWRVLAQYQAAGKAEK